MIAATEGEASGTVVRRLIRKAEQRRVRVYLSPINWGEVFYIVCREKGEVAAHEIVARLDVLPITLRGMDLRLVQAAASLKATHPIARADGQPSVSAPLRKPI